MNNNTEDKEKKFRTRMDNYITLKKMAYRILPEFYKAPLSGKREKIDSIREEFKNEKGMVAEEGKIVIMTLLFPDMKMYEMMKVSSSTDIASLSNKDKEKVCKEYGIKTEIFDIKKLEYSKYQLGRIIENSLYGLNDSSFPYSLPIEDLLSTTKIISKPWYKKNAQDVIEENEQIAEAERQRMLADEKKKDAELEANADTVSSWIHKKK